MDLKILDLRQSHNLPLLKIQLADEYLSLRDGDEMPQATVLTAVYR